MFVFHVITIGFAVQHCPTEEIGLCHDSKFFGNPTVREETMQELKDGYVRCGIIHLGAHLKFDVVNETPQVTVLTVVVDEGPLHIALSRTAAESLQQNLELFMKDWPEGTY